MLVLTRKVGQAILLDRDIKLTVCLVQGNQVRIGIDAPSDVGILRAELASDARRQPADQVDVACSI